MNYYTKVQGNNTAARTMRVTTAREILLKFYGALRLCRDCRGLKLWVGLSKFQHSIEDMFPLNWVSTGFI
jgi:hypothetical protein